MVRDGNSDAYRSAFLPVLRLRTSEATIPDLPNSRTPDVFMVPVLLPSIEERDVSVNRTPCPATYCFFSAFAGSAGAAWAGVAVTSAAAEARARPAIIRFIRFLQIKNEGSRNPAN